MTQLNCTYRYSFLGCPVYLCNQLSIGIIQGENIEIDKSVCACTSHVFVKTYSNYYSFKFLLRLFCMWWALGITLSYNKDLQTAYCLCILQYCTYTMYGELIKSHRFVSVTLFVTIIKIHSKLIHTIYCMYSILFV